MARTKQTPRTPEAEKVGEDLRVQFPKKKQVVKRREQLIGLAASSESFSEWLSRRRLGGDVSGILANITLYFLPTYR